MGNKTYIAKLLELFRQGKTDQKTNDELYNLFCNHPDSVKEVLEEAWEDASHKSDTVNPQLLLSHIHSRITPAKPSAALSLSPNFRTIALRIIPYAAVLLVGFFIAWLMFRDKASSADIAHYFKVKVEYGSKSTIELPDGSVVNLNSGSSLSYPAKFGENNRTVILEGEGFFDIRKDVSRPFYVKTRDITVKVLGTKFNVKSYPDENITETTLVSGLVEISDNNGSVENLSKDKPLVLSPNQKAVFYSKREIANRSTQNEREKEAVDVLKVPAKETLAVETQVKTELVTSWRNNILIFNSEPFSEIIKKLERWYNVEITLNYTKLSDDVFSGKFDKESIQEVLDALKLIEPFNYDINKNKIEINSN